MNDRGCTRTLTPHHTTRAGRLEWIALGLALAAVLFAAGFGDSSAPDVSTVGIKSRPGDTLWELADKYPVAGLSTAETARLIARLNGVDPGALPSGSTIQVPASDADSAVAMR